LDYQLKSVELEDIELTEQLAMPGMGDFWVTESLDEMAEEQGVSVVESIDVLRDNTISDEEADAFMAALEL